MKRLILVLAAMAILASCGDDDNGTNPTSNPLYPLAVGNTWIQKSTDYSFSQIEFDTVEILKMVKVGGKDVYLAIEDIIAGDTSWSGLYNDDFGLTLNWYEENTLQPAIKLKYPCSAGDKYTSQGILADSDIEVVSTSAGMAVPAGTFTCIKYIANTEINWNGDIMYNRNIMWVAPGIGVVKTELWLKENAEDEYELDSDSELQSYTLK